LLQELGDGRCHISCEVVGDPSDPTTTQREAIFKPLGLELTRQIGEVADDTGNNTLEIEVVKTIQTLNSHHSMTLRAWTLNIKLRRLEIGYTMTVCGFRKLGC
jgi:hypothetical protein